MESFETNERYLEMIFFLQKENDGVHAIDVCRAMGFSKPTISVKIKQLASEGFLTVDENEHIILLPKGLEIAEKISERHSLLTEVLEFCGVSHDVAESDACKIEHDLSDESFDAVKKIFSMKKR